MSATATGFADIVGIDLAAQPEKTGLVVLRGSQVVAARSNVTDEMIIDHVHHAAQVGVDVPFGWPQPFVEHLTQHARRKPTGNQRVSEQDAGKDSSISWRRTMAMRETDRAVHAATGVRPMSVSTDRIAYPALRWSVIEPQLMVDTARDGSGVVAEVYPAAALKQWGLPHRGYKKDELARRDILKHLSVEVGEFSDELIADDNVLDALIAALVARDSSGKYPATYCRPARISPSRGLDSCARAENALHRRGLTPGDSLCET